ncbi:hypothetical protein BAUCODRAFT_72021, partial [Baudoinia panamericana UAMH 10762]
GIAVRYAVVAVLFAAILLFFVGGYLHARHRIRKGLPPLRYHKWMVQQRMIYVQSAPMTHNRYSAHDGYAMEHYPPPPPAYTAGDAPPPVYQPPDSNKPTEQSTVHVQPLASTPTLEAESSGRSPTAGPRH